MVYHQFPDLHWLKKQAEQGFANRQAWGGKTLPTAGWPTIILNVKSRNTFRDNIKGPLSIFTNVSGASIVSCGNKRSLIQEGFFYVTNHDQYYTLEIDPKTPSETFNIHFGQYYADQVLRSMISSPEKLIDEAIFTTPFLRLELYNKLYSRDNIFNNIVDYLQTNCIQGLEVDEKLYTLLAHILRQDKQIKSIEQRIPALRNSTRQELHKRLVAATDYVYTFYNKDITLEELSGIACLSKFHFLRLFKIAFNKTPHQFINEIKVERAKSYLKRSNLEVNTIAKLLGFTNASSFSRTFYNHAGVYPSQYR